MTETPALPVSATGPQRTHPTTVLVHVFRSVPVIVGVGVVVIAQSGGAVLSGLPVGRAVLFGALLLIAVAALVGIGGYLSWSRRFYHFDEAGDLRVDSGVITRTQRRLALSRLQSVDVTQPLLARLVGMAEIRVEVAGTGDSRVVLQYLTLTEAQRLRDEVLARAAGLRPDVGTAPQNVLVSVPTGDLGLSLLLSSTTLVGVLATAAIVALAVLTEGAVGLLGLLVTGGVPIFSAFGQFVRFFGFTVAESPDGLRLRSGLTSTQAQTVPPGRVHAIEYEQPLLWRYKDWVRVQLTVAGAASEENQQGAGTTGVLLPVAPREVAEAVVDRVLPGLAVADLEWTPAPARARLRAPIQWRLLATAADGRVFAARRGRLVRRLALVPHARTQSVHLTQGPWQRRLGLASVRLDIAPGPIDVRALHQDADAARSQADAQALRAKAARSSAGPDRWMSRPRTDAGLDGVS